MTKKKLCSCGNKKGRRMISCAECWPKVYRAYPKGTEVRPRVINGTKNDQQTLRSSLEPRKAVKGNK